MIKKTFYLMILTSLCIACNRGGNNKSDSTEAASGSIQVEEAKEDLTKTDYRGAEIAYVKKDVLYFYYPETKETKRLVEEELPVFNCVFDNELHEVYYTVVKADSSMWLKKANYQNDKVEISEMVDLKLKKAECISDTYSERSQLIFTKNKDIVVRHNFSWEVYDFDKMTYYSTIKEGAKPVAKDFNYDILLASMKTEKVKHKVKKDNLIYFVDGKEVNLTDKLILKDPEDEYQTEALEFVNFKFSEDKSMLMFGAINVWGDLPHGQYCASSTDGLYQQKLEGVDIGSFFIPYWIGNQLVYMRSVGKEENFRRQLCISNPKENSVEIIDEYVDCFSVRSLSK